MKIFITRLLSATAFIIVTIAALCMLLFTSSSFSTALTPDDMKCQVCDVAAAHYGRTLLHAQLFCLNKAYVNATDGETQTKLAYLVRVLEPFKLPGIDKDFCTEDSPAKRNPGKNEGIPATALKKTNKDEAAAENEAKREAEEIDEVLSEEDSDNNDNKPVAGDNGENAAVADDKGLVVDSVTANEIGRKNWICRAFLDSFPAIEMFPAQEGKSFDPDDPKTYEGEEPQKVPQKFIEILKRACEISVASPRTNGKMVAAARKAVANFPVEDAPRTINGARNHIFKNVLRDVQNAACASNCPADVQRPKNFKAVAAFTVDNRPIIQ